MILLSLLPSSSLAGNFANSFTEQRYRGWLWFEDKPFQDKPKAQKEETKATSESSITPEEAKQEIEEFAKELESLKFMMLARPTPENVRNYREKEKQMWHKAETLHDAWDMANLMYPDQRDLINNPSNVHAVKAKRELDYKKTARE